MHRTRFAFLLLFAALPLLAQSPAERASCYADRKDNQPYRHKLWTGYEVSLGPARNSQGGGDECTAAIYNGAGKVVFRTTGFNVVFDEKLTGKDFDGDGQPDVVFETDSGGGMHCCWAYNVVSLLPTPHRLFDIDATAAVRFETDPRGRMVVWQRRMGPADFTSMAQRPAAEKVMRVQHGTLVDVTPEFCPKILAPGNEDYDEQQRVLTPENLSRFSPAARPDEETASALQSRFLQEVFCHQFDQALRDLEPWPLATRDQAKSSLADWLRTDFPAFAARLAPAAK